jgi:hypothetical protein
MPGIRAINAALGRVAKSNWTERAPKPPRPVVKINSANLKPNKIIKKNSPTASSNTDAIQKNSVKKKPAAKQKAAPKDMSQFIKKRAFRNENINYKQRGNDFINSGIQQPGPFSQGKTKLIRQIKASNKKKAK